MYKIKFTSEMKRNTKLMRKRGKDMSKLVKVLDMLASGEPLPPNYKDHPLAGTWNDFRECHIESDWLLVYQYHDDLLILTATATGTHADLFGL
ncbi:MAG: type II toxin-antitoxin system YafQ family toxin [Oscillospiraceae bacterium]|nr:type II toxin-antitoxin system YafQ family toxin [Oscillospiraceae bacterium]